MLIEKIQIKFDRVLPNGIIKPGYFVEANTLLGNYLRAFSSGLRNYGQTGAKSITGSTIAYDLGDYFFRCYPAIGTDDNGIVVGTGTTAPALEDYKLETQIVEGVGAGQIQHMTTDFPNWCIVNGNSIYTDLRRSFLNQSGGTLQIKECGIYSSWYSIALQFCWERSLYDYTCPNDEGFYITYRFNRTVV